MNLIIKSLDFSYQNEEVFKDLNLKFNSGILNLISGPSGSGKTTLLNLIAGLEKPSSGLIMLDDNIQSSIDKFVEPEKRNIGFIFQDFALFPHLTVWQNVGFGISKNNEGIREKACDLLSKVGLSSKSDKYPHELSGGEQQRVALIRALAPKPRIMLMDEPFSGLDKRLRDDIRDETLDILKSEETAVLLVTHEPEEAMKMADEIALMRNGAIVQKGAPYNLSLIHI